MLQTVFLQVLVCIFSVHLQGESKKLRAKAEAAQDVALMRSALSHLYWSMALDVCNLLLVVSFVYRVMNA